MQLRVDITADTGADNVFRDAVARPVVERRRTANGIRLSLRVASDKYEVDLVLSSSEACSLIAKLAERLASDVGA